MRNFEVIYLKKIISALIAFLMMFSFGCKRAKVEQHPIDAPIKTLEKEQYLKIMTTNKLLYYMIKDIVKDKHLVDYMLKTQEEQWNFKYTEDSINNISKKDLFIYSGAASEPWISGFVEELKKNKIGIVNASRGVKILSLGTPRVYLDENKKEIEYKDNPYYWVNPDDYKTALSNILNSIVERDPKNRDFYETNFSEALKVIDGYSKDIKLIGDNLKRYTFVTVGDEFDYYLKYLNVKTIKLDKAELEEVNKEKLEKKLGDSKNLVLVYSDTPSMQASNSMITKHNMRTIQLITYKFDVGIDYILKANYNSLNSLPVGF
jgi:ABC-type Zn uptake system ZnuABC Zn-binding protein ZnuA